MADDPIVEPDDGKGTGDDGSDDEEKEHEFEEETKKGSLKDSIHQYKKIYLLICTCCCRTVLHSYLNQLLFPRPQRISTEN